MKIDYLKKDKLRGQRLDYIYAASPFGKLLLVTTSAGEIVFLGFCLADELDKNLAKLRKQWRVNLQENKKLKAQIKTIFNGDTPDTALRLVLLGTPFQHRVWRALSKVKRGKTSSYGALAKKLNTSARAVGGAVGANPVSYLMPCHRILAANGALNGYRWGLTRKQKLLAAEA